MDPNSLTIETTRAAIAAKQITASALVEQFYDKIKAEDPEIHAYLTLCEDHAFAQAKHIDGLVSKGASLPPLAGVPIGIKDVMVTKGIRTMAGSKILGNFIPPYDCTAMNSKSTRFGPFFSQCGAMVTCPLAGVRAAWRPLMATLSR